MQPAQGKRRQGESKGRRKQRSKDDSKSRSRSKKRQRKSSKGSRKRGKRRPLRSKSPQLGDDAAQDDQIINITSEPGAGFPGKHEVET